MAPPRRSDLAPTTLSRHRLARILGLDEEASREEIDARLPGLLSRLGQRLGAADTEEAIRLREEIADLATSRAGIAAPLERFAAPKGVGRSNTRLGAVFGAGLTLCLLIAYASGYRIVQTKIDDVAALPTRPGILILDGPLSTATLRVFDADREELLHKGPADGAHLEVGPGRVALDVRREDCPDHWTRSVYFEERSIHRFEPEICRGQGRLTVRSNVSQDRLRIDGLEFGATNDQPHLLATGDHTIRVDKIGYQPFMGTVRIRPDEGLELRAELIADDGGGSPRGRPMPVTKLFPSATPSAALSSGDGFAALDMSGLGDSIANPTVDFEVSRLLPPNAEDAYYTASAAGSTRWHDRVSADMIARYDLDASGQIDQLAESEAISCRVWREIERDFDGGGLGLSMARYFGFDGSEWHPNALGFARAHRSAAFAKMKECGLQN